MTIRLGFRTTYLCAVIVVAGLIALASDVQAQSGNELFQRALSMERGNGQIREAITLYETIVRDFPSDRRLVARTLVQLGRAQEHLGEAEARKAYERVVREFPDQSDALREARERIDVLTKGDVARSLGVASARVVLVSDALSGSAVTADGRSLVTTDSTGNVALLDIRSRRITQVTHARADEGEFASSLNVSDDGQLFAFTWWNASKLRWELRTADRRTGAMRVLVSDSAIAQARPFSISSDQRQILTLATFHGDRPSELWLVDNRSGVHRVLRTTGVSLQTRASMSPDGKFVAYDAVDDRAAGSRNIHIIDVTAASEAMLVQHAADDSDPIWVPNGTGVFFVSTRNGNPAGWFVPVMNGRATGAPVLVKADVGVSRIGITRDGALFYVPINGAKLDVFLGELDVKSGTMTSTPTLVESRTNGSNVFPVWSRDGRYLAYVAGRGRDQSIRVRSTETGVETEVHAPAATVQLMPDNRSVVVANVDRTTAVTGAYHVDVSSGRTVTIVEMSAKTFNIRRPVPSIDGRFIYYVLWEIGKGSSIVRRELASGEERQLYAAADWLSLVDHLALSPDGQWLAAMENSPEGKRPGSRIILVPVNETPDTARRLDRLDHEPGSLTWAPDGRTILTLAPRSGRSELWTVPTDGSAPRRLNPNLGRNISSMQLNGDGHRIVLWIGDYRNELWVAEHFLPEPRPTRQR